MEKPRDGIIDLHGGNTEVGQDEIGAGHSGLRENPRQPGKVAAMGREFFRSVA